MRYREDIRRELERVGVMPLGMVRSVELVFARARERRAHLDGLLLRDRLIAVAREVGQEQQTNSPGGKP
jgi:hypothetical protein